METVVLIILILVGFNFILKLTYHRPIGIVVLCLIPLLFLGLATESASEQSKTQIADWLSRPELMLDTSVLLTIDVAFQICFCVLMSSQMTGKLNRWGSIMLAISLWVPGILLFPALYSLLVGIIFSMPGVDFTTIGWITGAGMLIIVPALVWGMKYLLPEADLRLELMFLINLLTAALGIIATVNGRTAAIGTNSVEWQALGAIFIIMIIGLCGGLIYFRISTNKKLKKLSRK